MPTRETGGGQSRATRRTDVADEVEASGESSTDVQERHEKLSEDVDAILDEIDEVLEENAEEFIRGYVQKGGQCPADVRPGRPGTPRAGAGKVPARAAPPMPHPPR